MECLSQKVIERLLSNSRFDIKSNGLISALPFIAQSFVCFFGGWITDVIITKRYFKTITVRKINTSLGLLVPAVTVVLAGKCLSKLPISLPPFHIGVILFLRRQDFGLF